MVPSVAVAVAVCLGLCGELRSGAVSILFGPFADYCCCCMLIVCGSGVGCPSFGRFNVVCNHRFIFSRSLRP